MNDPLKARLAKLQKFSDSAKRRANLYTDIAKMDDSHTARSLGALQKQLKIDENNCRKHFGVL